MAYWYLVPTLGSGFPLDPYRPDLPPELPVVGRRIISGPYAGQYLVLVPDRPPLKLGRVEVSLLRPDDMQLLEVDLGKWRVP